jgi:hypothetical protein
MVVRWRIDAEAQDRMKDLNAVDSAYIYIYLFNTYLSLSA